MRPAANWPARGIWDYRFQVWHLKWKTSDSAQKKTAGHLTGGLCVARSERNSQEFHNWDVVVGILANSATPARLNHYAAGNNAGRWLARRRAQEAFELLAANRVLQLAERLGLDLPHALASDLEDPPDLFERVSVAIAKAISQADNLPLAEGQRFEQPLDLLPQHAVRGRDDRAFRAGIFDEFAEAAILALAHRPIETDRVPADVEHAADFFDWHVGSAGRLFGRRLAPHFLQQSLRNVSQPREHVDHVDGNPDRAGLIGDRAGNRLANPPGGIGGELIAAAIFVFINRPHQARVPLLNQIEEAQSAIAIFLRDRDDQPQVAAGELPLYLLEILELRHHRLAADPQAPRTFLREEHQIAQLLAAGRKLLVRRGNLAQLMDSRPEKIHPPRHLVHLLDHLLHTARPQAQFFDERQRLAAATAESACGPRAIRRAVSCG